MVSAGSQAERGIKVSGESLLALRAVLGIAPPPIPAPPQPPVGLTESDDPKTASPEALSGRAAAWLAKTSRPFPRRVNLAIARSVEAALFAATALTIGIMPLALSPYLGGEEAVREDRAAAVVAAAHLNALAAGRGIHDRPLVMRIADCRLDAGWWPLVTLGSLGRCDGRDLGVVRTSLPDGRLALAVGPVGTAFGTDLLARLTRDPDVRWKAAFSRSPSASGLPWFEPTRTRREDMPTPFPGGWVHVSLERNGKEASR